MVLSNATASVACTFVLGGAAFSNVAAVASWATNQLAALCAGAMSIPQSWTIVIVESVSSHEPQAVIMPRQALASATQSRTVHTESKSESESKSDGSPLTSASAVSIKFAPRQNQLRGRAFRTAASSFVSISASESLSSSASDSDWLLAVNIVIQPRISTVLQPQVNNYANTLVTALNTVGSDINKQLANQSVAVLTAALLTPPGQDNSNTSSSSDFFSTAWHTAVVAVVIFLVVLLCTMGICVWRRRNANRLGSRNIGRSGGAGTGVGNAKTTAKYNPQLEDKEINTAMQTVPPSAEAEAEGDTAIQMTDMTHLNGSADSEVGGGLEHDHTETDAKASLKLAETDSEAEHFA